jgi:hypothetical protein
MITRGKKCNVHFVTSTWSLSLPQTAEENSNDEKKTISFVISSAVVK